MYLLRTATVASLAAALIVVGWMGTPSDEMTVAPDMGTVQTEITGYFPAGYELQANADEPEVYEYY
jgi:hypothetical protein